MRRAVLALAPPSKARVRHSSRPHRDGWGVHRSTLLLILLTIVTPLLHAQTVLRLTLHDTIQPITADYLKRGLEEAARTHASAVLISLGTPGGLLESTREMVTAIESSPTPVIIFIEPTGARAGSAGFYILESADIAAMAPGTNAGAAHPVLEGQTMDPVLKQKLENDAAAFLRSYVLIRGRNAQAADDAVRNSKSFSDTEALQLHLIDLVAPDDQALLAQLDNRTIRRFNGSSETLHLAHAVIVPFPPSARERLLTRLTNPDLDVLLLVCGALLIYLEFHVPGTIVPGTVGTLLVLLAVFGLNLLPIRHTAVLLLVAALALILLEAHFASHGALALVGVACLIFGLATLVDAPIPALRVHLSTAIAAGLAFGGISAFLAWIALRARRNKRLLGPQALLGRTAMALTDLYPLTQSRTQPSLGQVEVRGEIWQAVAAPEGSPIPAGAPVIIQSVNGLTLTVSPH